MSSTVRNLFCCVYWVIASLVCLSSYRMLFILIADYIVVFFFQAEDGIRDADVTGVQTCALPIYQGTKKQAGYGEITISIILTT